MLPRKGMAKRWILATGIPLAMIGHLAPQHFLIAPPPFLAASEEYFSDQSEPTEESDSLQSDGVWDLESLQGLARENNPTLQQAAASADMARGLYRQSGLYPNPQLGYLRNDSDNSAGPRSKGVFIGQEIVTTGKLKKAQAAESWEIELRNWNYQAQTRRVENDVELRFWDALAAQEVQTILQRLRKLAERSLTIAERQKEGKLASKADVLQARVQLKSVELLEREAAARYEAAWKQLETVTGCPGLQTLPLSGGLPEDFPELDWDSSYQRLMQESPLIQAAKARSQHFQGQYSLEVANRVPNLNVQVVADRDSNQKVSSVSTLLSMPIPVRNRNQGNIQRAAAETREAAAEISRTELALRDQLAETFKRYQSAKAGIEVLHVDVIPDAEEVLKLTITSYEAGEVGFLNVLTAQKTLVESRIAYIESQVEAARAQTEINGLLLTGALNPAELGTALQSQPGASSRRAILNQMEGGGGNGLLPAAVQTGGGP